MRPYSLFEKGIRAQKERQTNATKGAVFGQQNVPMKKNILFPLYLDSTELTVRLVRRVDIFRVRVGRSSRRSAGLRQLAEMTNRCREG